MPLPITLSERVVDEVQPFSIQYEGAAGGKCMCKKDEKPQPTIELYYIFLEQTKYKRRSNLTHSGLWEPRFFIDLFPDQWVMLLQFDARRKSSRVDLIPGIRVKAAWCIGYEHDSQGPNKITLHFSSLITGLIDFLDARY